jgi:hypothetical protein
MSREPHPELQDHYRALLAAGKGEPCTWCGAAEAAPGTCPKSIECPVCHAAPGQRCVRPSEHPAPELHAARWRRAEEIDARALTATLAAAAPRLNAQLDLDGQAHELAPQHERMRLFEPAPEQLDGQLGMGEL